MPNNFHCMVDVESWGTRSTSAISTLGAVAFDPDNGTFGAEFYRTISWKSCSEIGLTVDIDTIIFWLAQSNEARAEVIKGASSIKEALREFAAFYQNECGAKRIWSHGATFDLPILMNAYQRAGIDAAFHFRDARDTRTIFDLAKVELKKFGAADGILHHALHDSRAQARAVVNGYQYLRLTKVVVDGNLGPPVGPEVLAKDRVFVMPDDVNPKEVLGQMTFVTASGAVSGLPPATPEGF